MNLAFDPERVFWMDDRQRAQEMRARREWRDAAELYIEILARASSRDDQALWLEAGEFADLLGEAELAVTRLRHAAELPGERKAAATAALALALMHKGDFIAAGYAWRRVIALDAHSARAWAGLLVCALSAGRPGLARRVEKRLEGRASRHERRRLIAELWVHAANGQARVDEIEQTMRPVVSPLSRLLRESERALQRLTSRHTERADAYYHLAVCHRALGQSHAAREAVERALFLNPNYQAAREMERAA